MFFSKEKYLWGTGALQSLALCGAGENLKGEQDPSTISTLLGLKSVVSDSCSLQLFNPKDMLKSGCYFIGLHSNALLPE